MVSSLESPFLEVRCVNLTSLDALALMAETLLGISACPKAEADNTIRMGRKKILILRTILIVEIHV
jgi:hypothetical protein